MTERMPAARTLVYRQIIGPTPQSCEPVADILDTWKRSLSQSPTIRVGAEVARSSNDATKIPDRR